MTQHGLQAARRKMLDADVGPGAIRVFESNYAQLESGAECFIREADIAPLEEVDLLAELPADPAAEEEAIRRTAILKLNGGLGTSMGLSAAKTLLTVRDGLTFLDIIVRQVLAARRRHDARLPLLLMTSFRTHDDTVAFLERYPEVAVGDLPICFVQNLEPKLLVEDLTPATWPADPSLEWCPPGHGDVYTALTDSGLVDRLLAEGFEYLALGNGDNLGGAPDARIAGWFAASGAPYAAELCRRTVNDRKGGHLAIRRRDGRLILRDTAQTTADEMHFFTDTDHHPYFHTNNLWVRLSSLQSLMEERDGVLGLPLIRNEKTLDPTCKDTPRVVQMETAMGAAVEAFEGATAIGVGRERFVPVKTTADLLLLRSDLSELDEDYRLRAQGAMPSIQLGDAFRLIEDFDRRVPAPVSLRDARSLRVDGDVTFGRGVRVAGDAVIETSTPLRIPDGAELGGD